MNLFGVLELSGSALLAQRQRAEVVASNLANAETTQTPAGGPYRRQQVVFRAVPASEFAKKLSARVDEHATAVRVEQVVADPAPPVKRFDPGNPHADADGYVLYPSVNPVEEMVDLMNSARSYQLNASVVQATKAMIQQTLELLR